jgi:hypothetical protein
MSWEAMASTVWSAVVLLEARDLCIRVVGLEVEDDLDVALPGVDRLVGVADDARLRCFIASAGEHVPGMVGVLVLIDQQILEPSAAGQHVRVVAQGVGGLEEQVVEVGPPFCVKLLVFCWRRGRRSSGKSRHDARTSRL